MKAWLKGGLIGLLIGLIVNLSNFLQPVALWTFKIIVNFLFRIPESAYGGEWGGMYMTILPASILFYVLFGFLIGAMFSNLKEKYSKKIAFLVLLVVILPFFVVSIGQSVDLYRIYDANCEGAPQSSGCMAEYAFNHNDPSICDISRPPSDCYGWLAEKTLNLEDCELIQGYTEKRWYMRDASSEINYCKTRVYNKLAALYRDVTYCDKAEQLNSEDFHMDYCYGNVALVTNKPELCNVFQSYAKPVSPYLEHDEMMYAIRHDKDNCLVNVGNVNTKIERCNYWFEGDNREKCLA